MLCSTPLRNMQHGSTSSTSTSLESRSSLDDSVSSLPRMQTMFATASTVPTGSLVGADAAVGPRSWLVQQEQQRQQQQQQRSSRSSSGAPRRRGSLTTSAETPSSIQQQNRDRTTDDQNAIQPRQRQSQQRGQQHLQAQPLLNWRLAFRHPELEHSFWQQCCEQKLWLLDRMVMALNLLVLLNVTSSRLDRVNLALHAVSLLLLLAQGVAMRSRDGSYIKYRPLLVCAQRIWRALLRVHLLHQPRPAQYIAQVGFASTSVAASSGQRAAGMASTTSAAAGGSESAWKVMLECALINSGVIPSWAYAWAYQAPFGTAPILQGSCLLVALLADSGRLLQLLLAPQLQYCVAQCFNAVSTVSNWLLLPLMPLAAMPTALSCPAVPALPLLLWLQLFWAVAAPAYVLYQYEQCKKVWFWLQRLAGQQRVPDSLAREAQDLLRQVLPRHLYLRHAVVLVLLAALSWQCCELLYWVLPDSLLQRLLHMQ